MRERERERERERVTVVGWVGGWVGLRELVGRRVGRYFYRPTAT